MLEASSSPHKRQVTCAREFNSAQHPNEALVGTSRRSDQPVPAPQDFFGCRPLQRRRRQPAHFERSFQFCGCGVKRRIGCKMRMAAVILYLSNETPRRTFTTEHSSNENN